MGSRLESLTRRSFNGMFSLGIPLLYMAGCSGIRTKDLIFEGGFLDESIRSAIEGSAVTIINRDISGSIRTNSTRSGGIFIANADGFAYFVGASHAIEGSIGKRQYLVYGSVFSPEELLVADDKFGSDAVLFKGAAQPQGIAPVIPDIAYFRRIAEKFGVYSPEKLLFLAVNTRDRALEGRVNFCGIKPVENLRFGAGEFESSGIFYPGNSGSPVYLAVRGDDNYKVLCDESCSPLLIGLVRASRPVPNKVVPMGESYSMVPNPYASNEEKLEAEEAEVRMHGGYRTVNILWGYNIYRLLERNKISPNKPQGDITLCGKI